MANSLKQTTAIIFAVAALSMPAMADTVSNVRIISTTPFSQSDENAVATNGTATLSGPSTSLATQNADGTSEVEAATTSAFSESKVVATAEFEQSETNTSGMARDYTLSYNLTGQSATFDAGFVAATATAFGLVADPVLPATPTNPLNPFSSADNALPTDFTQFSGASFEYNIEVNGVLIFNARADALLNGFSPFGGPVIDVESNFDAQISGFTFSVGAIEDDIFLGSFEDGETIDVVSSLTARAYTPGGAFDGFAIGVNTFSSDPISLSSIGALSSTPTTTTPPVSTVPVPAAGWLLLAGLGGLAAARRKS